MEASRSAGALCNNTTGTIPSKNVISTRRMIYLQNILKKSKEEVVRKVYEAQKVNPVKGNWTELIKRGFNDVGIHLDEAEIIAKSKSEHKCTVKRSMNQHVFSKLKNLQNGHS